MISIFFCLHNTEKTSIVCQALFIVRRFNTRQNDGIADAYLELGKMHNQYNDNENTNIKSAISRKEPNPYCEQVFTFNRQPARFL